MAEKNRKECILTQNGKDAGHSPKYPPSVFVQREALPVCAKRQTRQRYLVASRIDGNDREPEIPNRNKKPSASLAEIPGRILNALLAQDCLLCGQSSGNRILCAPCIASLACLPEACCPICALPTPCGERCGRCLSHPPHYDRTQALFSYAFPLDKLVQALKYDHRLALAPFFGQWLAEKAAGIAADRIVPLPLHPIRLRERGFNQAQELARPIARSLNLPLDTACCRRTRHTPTQASLPWKEREKNIRNAFHCTNDLSGRRILLVDDVMTTGASLNECARTLKQHGALEVTLLVLARTLP